MLVIDPVNLVPYTIIIYYSLLILVFEKEKLYVITGQKIQLCYIYIFTLK